MYSCNSFIFSSEDRFHGTRGMSSSYLKSKVSGCEPGEYTSLPSKHSHNQFMHPVHDTSSYHSKPKHAGCRHNRINGVSTCSADCTAELNWKPSSLARSQSFGHKSSSRCDPPINESNFPKEERGRNGKCSSLSCKLGAVSIDGRAHEAGCGVEFGSATYPNQRVAECCSHHSKNEEEGDLPKSAHSLNRYLDPENVHCCVKEDRNDGEHSSSPLFDRRRSLDTDALGTFNNSLNMEEICHLLVRFAYIIM